MAYTSFTPVFSGFSTQPTATGRYKLTNKMCHTIITATVNGTSNEGPLTSFRVSLPFVSNGDTFQTVDCALIVDNGTKQTIGGIILIAPRTNTGQVYLNGTLASTWTASGEKSFSTSFVYQTYNILRIETSDSYNARPVVLAWGQSNLGYGTTTVASDLEAEYKTTYPNVRFLRNPTATYDSVEPVTMDYSANETYQNNTENGTYSLQFYLYPELQAITGRKLYINHYSEGNTGLAVEWKPTATIGDNFRRFLFRTNHLIKLIEDVDGLAPDVKFMLIVHGEYDARVLAYANDYQTNLTNFINNFRTQSGLTTLPIVILKLNEETITAPVNPCTYGATIRTAQTNVAGALSYVYLVESNGAEMQSDKIHYTVTGEHTLTDSILAVVNANNLMS